MTRTTRIGGFLALVPLLFAAGMARATVVTRGPYLQMPTPGSMIVRWRTDVACDSRVRHGAAPGSLGTTVDDSGVTTEHVVTVPGLAPDTLYYYSVGSVAGAFVGDDADHFFRSPPVAGTVRPTRIWVTGDGGFANADGQAVRDAFAAYNAGGPTDLWLLLGDNAYLIGSDANYQAALFDLHHDMLRHVPVWPTFGNHEALSSNSLTGTGPYFDMFSLPTAGEAGGVPSGTEAYYSFDHANMHFIVLDSQSAANTPGSPMMLWLESDLQATTADWIIAFWHHPPYSKGLLHDSDVEANEINMRGNVLPLLEDYGVDLVLTGHSHSYERSHLIDGHYGLSPTLTSTMVLDSGDGRTDGDGAYRKATTGPAPHEGAVYVVAGSSSEVRPATLNHPVMEIGLLELGSLVLDVNGSTLVGTFVNSLVQATDHFTIEKGSACPPAPRGGCGAAPVGRLVLRQGSDDAGDRLTWRWRGGTLDATDLGSPDAQTDLAVCVYDQAGRLAGGTLPHGADMAPGATWIPLTRGFFYRDVAGANAGVTQLKLKPGTGHAALVLVRGKGAGLGVGTLPATPPLTAQLVNLDRGTCWESVFAATRRNDASRVIAATP
jgi:hypothetical protein